MIKAGKGATKKKPPPKPASFGSEFEKALYEKPAFKALYEQMKAARLQNEINLIIEYMNNPRNAKVRYGGTAKYDETVAQIEAALTAKVEQVIKSGRLFFSGFPSNMGEGAVKMTLEGFGKTLTGRAEFETKEAAEAAIKKYDGVDMGLGTKLELQAL